MGKFIEEHRVTRDEILAIARTVAVTPAAIYQWTQVPAPHCRGVEKVTGISRHKLRPDVFGRDES